MTLQRNFLKTLSSTELLINLNALLLLLSERRCPIVIAGNQTWKSVTVNDCLSPRGLICQNNFREWGLIRGWGLTQEKGLFGSGGLLILRLEM